MQLSTKYRTPDLYHIFPFCDLLTHTNSLRHPFLYLQSFKDRQHPYTHTQICAVIQRHKRHFKTLMDNRVKRCLSWCIDVYLNVLYKCGCWCPAQPVSLTFFKSKRKSKLFPLRYTCEIFEIKKKIMERTTWIVTQFFHSQKKNCIYN